MRRIFSGVLLSLSLAASIAPAQAAESDGEKFVRLTRQFERDPLNDPGNADRRWMIQWVTDTSDVSVAVCDLLGPVPGDGVPYSPQLLVQMMFGNASFQVQHPDRKRDRQTTQMAGIRSAMAAYASIIAGHPEGRIPYFDELLQKDRAGELERFMAPKIAEKCETTAEAGNP